MVKLKNVPATITEPGIVLKVFMKKCWRTGVQGKKIDWGSIDPEPHAEIMMRGDITSIPTVDLEVIHECR